MRGVWWAWRNCYPHPVVVPFNVWALVHGKLQKCVSSAHDFLSLARTLVEKLSKKDLETWAMVAWSIWNARNRVQFEATQTSPHAILKGAVSFLDEYQRLARSMAHCWAHAWATWSLGGPLYTFSFFLSLGLVPLLGITFGGLGHCTLYFEVLIYIYLS